MDKKKRISCKIVDIKEVPYSQGMHIISVRFNDGEKQWHRGYRLKYDRTISLEEFKHEIMRVGYEPQDDIDPYKNLKESIDKDFSIEVSDQAPEFEVDPEN